MRDEFQVQPAALVQQAGIVAKRQPVSARLADGWQAAAQAVSTGDAGLDQQTAALAATAQRLSQTIGQVLAALAGRMTAAAGNYRDGDARAAAGYQSRNRRPGRSAPRRPARMPLRAAPRRRTR